MTATSTAGDIGATWQGLARLPQLLGDVRGGVLAARALISTPSAAMATGSPAAGAAIWALGAELGIFIAQTVQAIDDDIDGLRQTLENYQRNDEELAAQAGQGVQAIDGLAALDRPALNGSLQSCISRGVLTTAAGLEAPARVAGDVATSVGDASEGVLRHGARSLDHLGARVSGVLDGVPVVGDDAAAAVRAMTGAGSDVLDGAAGGLDDAQGVIVDATDGVEAWADGRERIADLQGSCAPAGAR